MLRSILVSERAVERRGEVQAGDDDERAARQRQADVPLPGGAAEGRDGGDDGTTGGSTEGAPRPLQGGREGGEGRGGEGRGGEGRGGEGSGGEGMVGEGRGGGRTATRWSC